jgi:hypothetical protein
MQMEAGMRDWIGVGVGVGVGTMQCEMGMGNDDVYTRVEFGARG